MTFPLIGNNYLPITLEKPQSRLNSAEDSPIYISTFYLPSPHLSIPRNSTRSSYQCCHFEGIGESLRDLIDFGDLVTILGLESCLSFFEFFPLL